MTGRAATLAYEGGVGDGGAATPGGTGSADGKEDGVEGVAASKIPGAASELGAGGRDEEGKQVTGFNRSTETVTDFPLRRILNVFAERSRTGNGPS